METRTRSIGAIVIGIALIVFGAASIGSGAALDDPTAAGFLFFVGLVIFVYGVIAHRRR